MLIATSRELWVCLQEDRVVRIARGPEGLPDAETTLILPGSWRGAARGEGDEVLLVCRGEKKRGLKDVPLLVALVDGQVTVLWRGEGLVAEDVHLAAWKDAEGRRCFAIACQETVYRVTISRDGAHADRVPLDLPVGEVIGLACLGRSGRLLISGYRGHSTLIYFNLAGKRLDQTAVLLPARWPVEGPEGGVVVGLSDGRVVSYPPGGKFAELGVEPAHKGEVALMETSRQGLLFSVSRAATQSEMCVWDLRSKTLIQRLSLDSRVRLLSWDETLDGLWVALSNRLVLLKRQP